jgi:hypothetical protein
MGQRRIARVRQTPHPRNVFAHAWAYDSLPRREPAKTVARLTAYTVLCDVFVPVLHPLQK